METSSMLQALGSAERDAKWLDKNYAKLLEKYPDSFVAINNGEVVDASKNFQELLKKVESKKLNPANIMIEFMSKIKRIL